MVTPCVLWVIDTPHRRMRTNVVSGHCTSPPTLNEPFVVTAPPLHLTGGVRVVQTSRVTRKTVHFEKGNGNIRRVEFSTESGSRYCVVITYPDNSDSKVSLPILVNEPR